MTRCSAAALHALGSLAHAGEEVQEGVGNALAGGVAAADAGAARGAGAQ